MSGETCSCCAGIEASTPGAIANRIGLSAIAYRIGEYARFRESMLSGLSSSKLLAGLRTRDPDDYTLGLIDAFACAADVLTFYQERLANESYLRTATERVSVQEMGKLLGYHLRPGLAAETWLAFALETPKEAPPRLPPEPGAFVTGIPTALTLEAGLKVQSVPGPDERPQTFETVESLDARPEWNAVRPWLSEKKAVRARDTKAWIKGIRNNLKVGDALLFVAGEFLKDPTGIVEWDFRLIATSELDVENDRTEVTWQLPLSAAGRSSNGNRAPLVFALRKRASVFGHNAPLWRSMNPQFRKDYGGEAHWSDAQWPDFVISEEPPTGTGGSVDLEAVASEVGVGSLVVLAKGDISRLETGSEKRNPVELYRVAANTEVSLAAFALSGKVSRLELEGLKLKAFFTHPRATVVYAQSDKLTLAEYPVTDPVADAAIPLELTRDGLFPGRRVVIRGERAAGGGTLVHEATLEHVSTDPRGVVLTIAPPLPATLERDTVVVHLNVALATHGETGAQILGAGDASRSFQRFELRRLPLTYRSSPDETGADSELTVRIGDVEWAERTTMFGAGPHERTYVVDTDEQGAKWVVFGDGVRGARLPSGVNNVRASYRRGLGQEGNVGHDKLTQLMTRPLGLKSVSNPVAAQGGTDPEPAGQARRTIPLGTRTLGRVVSVLDYEDFAMARDGVAKAQARVLHLAAGPAVVITVAGQDGQTLSATNPVWKSLKLALANNGDPHVEVVLLSYQPSTFRLGLKIMRDPAYALKHLFAEVERTLRSHYGFEPRSFGQPVLQSEIVAIVHAVPGVVAVDLDLLYGGTEPVAQIAPSRQTRLLASRMRVTDGIPLPSELLTLHPAPLDRLEEMP